MMPSDENSNPLLKEADKSEAQQRAFDISLSELNELNNSKDVALVTQSGGPEGLAKSLFVDLKQGLTTIPEDSADRHGIESRKSAFGSNVQASVESKSFIALVMEQLEDPIIILLIIAATLSTILGAAIPEERKHQGWIEGVAIWVAVVVVALVGATNDYQKDQQFRKLNEQKEEFDVSVIRDGREALVKNTELVVGDVLMLNTGDRVTADGILFYNNDLVIDEASLTGESETVHKRIDRDPFCRSGTQVTEGSGQILVVAVGPNSEWGQTLALVTGETEETPLQEKLGDLAAAVGKIGFVVAVSSFIVLVIRWCVEKNGFPIDEINEDGPLQFFLFAVTIVVVAVPEGLPLAVTISLAYSMRKMMKDNNFVRVLAACETMGGATAICSDKTGTLTENRMTVVEGWFQGNHHVSLPTESQLKENVLQKITNNVALNSTAFLVDEDDGTLTFVGNRTECALLMLIRGWNKDYRRIREQRANDIIKFYGFNSAKKMASVVVNENGQLTIFNKGAAEMVLELCNRFINSKGEVEAIYPAKREELQELIKAMASRGLRTLALTYNELRWEEYSFSPDNEPLEYPVGERKVLTVPPEEDLILTNIVGIKDPVRGEVPLAVAQCKSAGIVVRMVTGDNLFTAKHIAAECGIYTDGGMVMEGPEFRRRAAEDEEAVKTNILPHLQVLARSTPTDKHTLVRLLREKGDVVSVTGDGTNDAPALKESDVGLAMGIAGTEVAKEAADIVILDDNFKSIVKAVLWGRSVFNNIRKFLQFQLTVNVVAMGVAFVASIAGGETPLNVLQLLWVNLIMDTLAALALATENPTEDLLKQKPHGREEPLISKSMWMHILSQSLYQFVVIFLVLFGAPSLSRYEIPVEEEWKEEYCRTTSDMYHGEDVSQLCKSGTDKQFHDWIHDKFEDAHDDSEMRKNSVIFNAFIFMQIFNEVNARKINNEYNIFGNIFESSTFCVIFVGIAGLQLLIMFTPLRQFFKVNKLNKWEWLFSVLVGLGVMPFSMIVRFFLKSSETSETESSGKPHNESERGRKPSFIDSI